MKNKKAKTELFGGVFVVVFIIVALVAAAGFDTVDASTKGVKVKFGEVQGTMNSGMEWTGLFVNVYPYDLRVRKMNVDLLDKDVALDKDGQEIYANIEINYRLSPDEVENAYSDLGLDKNGNLETLLNVEGVVREGFKSVISKYELKDIVANRDQVKTEAINTIRQRFEDINYFQLDNVIITNLDFNEQIKNAINAQKVAVEQAKAKEEQLKIAEANKQVQIKNAEAANEQRKLEADAEAYQIERMAEAEAKALELKAQELTELMVRNNWIDAWAQGGSQVPQYILGGDDMSMLMTMPTQTTVSE